MGAAHNGKVSDSFTSIQDTPLHLHRHKGKDEPALPSADVLGLIDAQELNRMFVRRYGCLRGLTAADVVRSMPCRAVTLLNNHAS